MKIIISIVVPTYKRKDSMIRLLKSLVPQTRAHVEIIIVEQVIDNGRDFENFVKKHALNFHYYFLPDASTSHAKNVGVRHAKGKYIIFLDDDVVIEKDFLSVYQTDFTKNQYPIIAGKVLTKGHLANPESKNVGKISYWGNFSDDFGSDIPQEVDTMIGCNAGWRKDIFEKLGGFDEQFTGNAMREESDISLRAKKAGYHIMYEPHAIIHHLREERGGARKTEGRLQWYFNFLSNETYFFLKHRPIFMVPIILLTRWEWIVRCMFGFGREVSLRSMVTPFAGIRDGFRKYRKLSMNTL